MKRCYHLIKKKLKCVLFRNATSALSNTHSNNAGNNLADRRGGRLHEGSSLPLMLLQ